MNDVMGTLHAIRGQARILQQDTILTREQPDTLDYVLNSAEEMVRIGPEKIARKPEEDREPIREEHELFLRLNPQLAELRKIVADQRLQDLAG